MMPHARVTIGGFGVDVIHVRGTGPNPTPLLLMNGWPCASLEPGGRVDVPTAICMWPKDLLVAPREWAERSYDVRRYSLQERGGHFPAWEAPEAYARDLRLFARSLGG